MFGRTKVKGFFDKTRIHAPKEEWIIVENTHEPIISQELWDTVQQLMKSRRRENCKGEVQMFAGLIKCSKCGSALNVISIRRKENIPAFPAGYMNWHGYREDLDNYFCRLYLPELNPTKPKQDIPNEIVEIIQLLEQGIHKNKIDVAHFFFNMSSEAKNDFCRAIHHALTSWENIKCYL